MTGDKVTVEAPDPDAPILPIVCGLITGGNVRAELMESVITSILGKKHTRFLVIPCGPYLDMGRNNTVREFNAHRATHPELCEYLLFVDSDIAYTPDDVQTLYDAAEKYRADWGVAPLVAGIYQGTVGSKRKVIAYDWKDVLLNTGDRQNQLHNVLLEDMDPPRLRPTDAFGTGFMLIHHSILDSLEAVYANPQEWFIETVVDGTWFGEDLLFCIRAAEQGHPCFVHTGVRLTHYKEIGLAF